jgi:hypothetical protein
MFPSGLLNNQSQQDYDKRLREDDKVWNAAIEAALLALHDKLKYCTEACAIIRGLKK